MERPYHIPMKRGVKYYMGGFTSALIISCAPSNRRSIIARRICLPLVLVLISNSLLIRVKLAGSEWNLTDTVDVLKKELGISNRIDVRIVANNKLAASVEPDHHGDFLLSLDTRFLDQLDQEELTAALAHELGHVWIYTHHPFLHTEALANQIAMKVVTRDSLKKLYAKVWDFEGTPGSLDQVLGSESGN